ncbi:PREDICTED: uncharacterized protein LOC107342547 [Acropora digitifera]|uniref:uncharacterized protein LOC107342547 n=1 Tax=Acropora digitifera TaxID=70779 RepID=UPI00077AE100|nr:PREDICTED: uncharacterized protein LOC107342547 [Acropora digitifera]
MKNIEHVKEAKRPTFKVITPNRLFLLVSSSTTDMNLWSQTLMEAIITTKRENELWKKGGDMAEPDKAGLLKKQGHNMVADWKMRRLLPESILLFFCNGAQSTCRKTAKSEND